MQSDILDRRKRPRAKPGEKRYKKEDLLEFVNEIDKYYNIYLKNMEGVTINTKYIKEENIFGLSLLFKYIDYSLDDETYANRLNRMIKDFNYEPQKDENTTDEELEAQKLNKVEVYLDMLTYFRNIVDGCIKGDYILNERGLKVMVLSAILSDTMTDLISLYPAYENKYLRNNFDNCLADDLINFNNEYEIDRVILDLETEDVDIAKYAGKTISDLNIKNRLFNAGRVPKYDRSAMESYRYDFYTSYHETDKSLTFTIDKYIFDLYMDSKDVDYNRLSDDMARRLDDCSTIFGFIRNKNASDDRAYKEFGAPEWYKAYYIDGKPMLDYVPRKYKNNPDSLNRFCTRFLIKTAIKQEKIIEKVSLINSCGNVGISIKMVKLKSHMDQVYYNKTFSPFRQWLNDHTFFKLPELHAVERALSAKIRNTNDTRLQKIKTYVNDKYVKPHNYVIMDAKINETNVEYAHTAKINNVKFIPGQRNLNLVDIRDELDKRDSLEDDLKSNLSESIIDTSNKNKNIEIEQELNINTIKK